VINFTDNGTGLDLKKYGKDVFGLYKRFHSNTEGSGVGLYTVKSQLSRYGGNIDVKSTPGVETTFTVSIQPR
jgi:signal transduction histidine kinase